VNGSLRFLNSALESYRKDSKGRESFTPTALYREGLEEGLGQDFTLESGRGYRILTGRSLWDPVRAKFSNTLCAATAIPPSKFAAACACLRRGLLGGGPRDSNGLPLSRRHARLPSGTAAARKRLPRGLRGGGPSEISTPFRARRRALQIRRRGPSTTHHSWLPHQGRLPENHKRSALHGPAPIFWRGSKKRIQATKPVKPGGVTVGGEGSGGWNKKTAAEHHVAGTYRNDRHQRAGLSPAMRADALAMYRRLHMLAVHYLRAAEKDGAGAARALASAIKCWREALHIASRVGPMVKPPATDKLAEHLARRRPVRLLPPPPGRRESE